MCTARDKRWKWRNESKIVLLGEYICVVFCIFECFRKSVWRYTRRLDRLKRRRAFRRAHVENRATLYETCTKADRADAMQFCMRGAESPSSSSLSSDSESEEKPSESSGIGETDSDDSELDGEFEGRERTGGKNNPPGPSAVIMISA